MKQENKIFLINMILGHLFLLLHVKARGLFIEEKKLQQIFHILADGFFVPSVLLLGLGLLAYIARDGQFDGLKYAFYVLRERFPFLRKDTKTLDFGAYRESRKQKKTPVWPMLIAGAYFLFWAILFNLLFTFRA